MKILVTGATGFVGRYVTEQLVQEGHQVRALVRPSTDSAWLQALGVQCVTGTLTNLDSLQAAIDGCQLIYHLAALTSRQNRTASDLWQVNVEGTRNLAQAAAQASVRRLVYVSTLGVHGSNFTPPLDEQTPVAPNTGYRRTKWQGEQVVLGIHRLGKLPVVIARIGSIIGPHGTNWLGLMKAIASGRFGYVGNGSNRVQLTYGTDIAQGIIRCGIVPGIEGELFALAGPKSVMLSEFVGHLAGELGVSIPQKHSPALPFWLFQQCADRCFSVTGIELPFGHRYNLFFSDYLISIAKAQQRLKYAPVISLEESVHLTVDWTRKHGYLPHPV
ncbi:MAG TPA: NAD-dependent epimerase/dehydratase family protein [Acidobacteriota bacterium]|nr:NAD-dependent epimerase/dehydratase family protein [Acidobacteriota bacterium]HNB70335.1 NAD-dependent epimerase/dehydratase family protein [Acidobacteriota bacterium]